MSCQERKAKGSNGPAHTISAEILTHYQKLRAEPPVEKVFDFLEKDHELRVKELIEITEIPASPFGEAERAQDFARRMKELGLKDVHIDKEGNVIGLLPGKESHPKLVISAHLDTVFPEGYDAKVTIDEDGVLHAPGISDDCAGLSALLAVARAYINNGIKPVGSIWFVGTVGEEGLGDLRGSKRLFADNSDIDGFISIDGGGVDNVNYLALGSKRFRFSFTGPGGHSFGAYGEVANPIHAMGRAIAKIAEIKVPESPKTTMTVSMVQGGTSVNSIPAAVEMLTDTRSACPEQLELAVSQLVNCVKQAVTAENASWNLPWNSEEVVSVKIELLGDRPCGFCEDDALHVQAACAATEVMGVTPVLKDANSTDSSVPISLGIPAVTLGRGGKGMKAHSPQESYDPKDAYLAPQRVFLFSLGLVGMQDGPGPLLPESPAYEYDFCGVNNPVKD